MFAPCSFKEECSNLRLSFASHLLNDSGQMDILIHPLSICSEMEAPWTYEQQDGSVIEKCVYLTLFIINILFRITSVDKLFKKSVQQLVKKDFVWKLLFSKTWINLDPHFWGLFLVFEHVGPDGIGVYDPAISAATTTASFPSAGWDLWEPMVSMERYEWRCFFCSIYTSPFPSCLMNEAMNLCILMMAYHMWDMM